MLVALYHQFLYFGLYPSSFEILIIFKMQHFEGSIFLWLQVWGGGGAPTPLHPVVRAALPHSVLADLGKVP
jgi:hypothetical protein